MQTKYLSPSQKQSPTTPTKIPSGFIRDNTYSYSTVSSYPRKSQEILEEDAMKQELNYLKNRVYYLESKIGQQGIVIEQLLADIKVWSNQKRQDEAKELQVSLSQLEMKLREESRKDKTQLIFLQNTLFQTRAELESKIMGVEEQVRSTNRQIEANCKMFFKIQSDVNKLDQELKQQIFNHNKTADITYYIDKKGYLVDNQGHYILDQDNSLVRLSMHQLEQIKKQFKVELDK